MNSKEQRKQEIISNLEEAIQRGGNGDTIEKLKEILKNVKNDTHVVKKRPGRKRSIKPTKKKEE